MHIIDSHFHYWPRHFFEGLVKRSGVAFGRPNAKGGYDVRTSESDRWNSMGWDAWHDLDAQFQHMAGLGHEIDVVGSIGPMSVFFSALSKEEGKEKAIEWNEAMADAQRRYPGRFWGSAAIPMQDTKIAMDVLEDAIGRLGLMGVNLPGSVGKDARIDAERLEPYYARCAELGLPMFLHPTDMIFSEMLDG